MMHISFAPSGLKQSIVNTFFVPHYLHSAAEFGSQLAFGYYGDRSGSRQGQEGLFQTKADRESEECDSD